MLLISAIVCFDYSILNNLYAFIHGKNEFRWIQRMLLQKKKAIAMGIEYLNLFVFNFPLKRFVSCDYIIGASNAVVRNSMNQISFECKSLAFKYNKKDHIIYYYDIMNRIVLENSNEILNCLGAKWRLPLWWNSMGCSRGRLFNSPHWNLIILCYVQLKIRTNPLVNS